MLLEFYEFSAQRIYFEKGGEGKFNFGSTYFLVSLFN